MPLLRSGSPLFPQTNETGLGGEGTLWRAAIALVLAAGALRLALAAATPLVPDEAYYWEWSRRLAPGYFDHPPGIALLIRAGTLLFGDTPFGVRFFSVLAGVATLLLVVDLARRHGGARAAWYAAVITTCVPLAAAGLVLAAPDAPLLLAYALGLNALDRALAAPAGSRDSRTWWLVAGVAVGFGLASKYTAVLLPLGVLLAFVARPSLRHRLRTAEPYLASLVALVLFAPVVAWNARHEWASFAFQLQNGLGSSGSGSPLGRILDLLANQIVLVSPVLFGVLGLAVILNLRQKADDRRFTLAMVAVTTFGFFAYAALRERVEPNWQAPAYLPGFALLALVVAAGRWKRWFRTGSAVGGAMIALIYLQSLYPVLPVPARKDPMSRGYGWEMLARAVETAAPPPGSGDGGSTWIGTNRYQDAAQLAFLLPNRPAVFSLNIENRPNQYDYWPGFTDRADIGDSLLLALEEGEWSEDVIRSLRPHFQEVRRGDIVELRRGSGLLATRQLWLLQHWQGGWPK
jgi:4-amino-4-deoxy-L-arabinose transferase-like glycosyltransferase